MPNTEYRSPLRKLVTFFETSRDKWKAKCQQAKYELKLLKRRLANLRKNRELWQQRYQEAETQREQLQAQGEHLHDQNLKLQAQVEAISQKKGGSGLLALQADSNATAANGRLSKASSRKPGARRSRSTIIPWDRSPEHCR